MMVFCYFTTVLFRITVQTASFLTVFSVLYLVHCSAIAPPRVSSQHRHYAVLCPPFWQAAVIPANDFKRELRKQARRCVCGGGGG